MRLHFKTTRQGKINGGIVDGDGDGDGEDDGREMGRASADNGTRGGDGSSSDADSAFWNPDELKGSASRNINDFITNHHQRR